MTHPVFLANLLMIVGGAIVGAPLGDYLAAVWTGRPTPFSPVFGPIEQGLRRFFDMGQAPPQDSAGYGARLLAFNGAGFVLVYGLWRFSTVGITGCARSGFVSPDLAFRLAMGGLEAVGADASLACGGGISLVAVSLGVLVAGACNLAAASAVCRAFAASGRAGLGNVWSDLIRDTVHVLLPVGFLAVLTAIVVGVADPVASVADAWATVLGIAANALRFACAVAFGRIARARADGGILAVVMAVGFAAAAWAGTPVRPMTVGLDPLSLARLAGMASMARASALSVVGSGLPGALTICLLGVCLGGLLMGRTPEYVGNRLNGREVKLLFLASLGLIALTLGFALTAITLPDAVGETAALRTAVTAGGIFHNTASGVALALGRYGVVIPLLTIAQGVAAKPRRAPTAGTSAALGGRLVVMLAAATCLLVLWRA